MTYRAIGSVLAVALSTITLAALPARAQGIPPATVMKVATCVVSSTTQTDKKYDCAATVASACDGKTLCWVPIGLNLTEGKDINPQGGYLGKVVTITFVCGDATIQRGPYQQSDHATLLLDCR